MHHHSIPTLRQLVTFNKKFNTTDSIDHSDVLTILQQGVLLKMFRTVSKKIFTDEQVIRLQDKDILAGKVTVDGEEFSTVGVLRQLLPSASAYSPEPVTLNIMMDWFSIAKQMKSNYTGLHVPPKHVMIITGAVGALQRTVYGITLGDVSLYVVNKTALIFVDNTTECFSVMSMQNILGNWIYDRQLSDHNSRTPSLIYLAHDKLKYKNIAPFLAVQDVTELGKGDQVYIPMPDYDHGMYVNEQLTHREWAAIKKHYCFDVVDGVVMSHAQIAEQVRLKAIVKKTLSEEVKAVEQPLPRVVHLT